MVAFMELTRFKKFLVSLWFVGIVLWIGGSLVRYIIAYDIFEPGTQLELKKNLAEQEILLGVRHFAIGTAYTASGFIVALICWIVLLPSIAKKFKANGWLLMGSVLFAIASVFELILLYMDIQLSTYIFWNFPITFNSYEIQTFFYKRLKNLSFMFVYNWLSIVTILFFIVFKPLTKKGDEN